MTGKIDYDEIKKQDRAKQRAAFAATDHEAEKAMMMDFNGIRRDKSNPEFERRVEIRKSQNVG